MPRKNDNLVFLKLGGSLITDKAQPYTPDTATIHRLAREIKRAREVVPNLQLLIGHGSGSFGHQAAARYATQQGVRTAAEWRGFAEVATAAARLNRIASDALIDAGIPAMSLQPSASARCKDGELISLAFHPIEEALAHGLVPLIYGDVALDDARGGTIASTEKLFIHLARRLHPHRIVLAGSFRGVLDGAGNVIPLITPASIDRIRPDLDGAAEVDVTGGMADKVTRMVTLARDEPQLSVHILSGAQPGNVEQALITSDVWFGTLIAAH
jgi:isopentenyl phosphate kinase